MKFKIALIQMNISNLDYIHSFKEIDAKLYFAKQRGANIAVLPEACIGFCHSGFEFDYKNDLYLKEMIKLSKKHSIDTVSTFREYDEKSDGFYNVSYYINEKGEVLHKHKKMYPWAEERFEILRGDKIESFNTKYGRFAIAICHDITFPETGRSLIDKDVDMLIVPSFWAEPEDEITQYHYDYLNSLCFTRAYENSFYVAFCNSAGKYDSYLSLGISQIISPTKGVMKKSSKYFSEIIIHEIDTKEFKEHKKFYTREDYLRWMK